MNAHHKCNSDNYKYSFVDLKPSELLQKLFSKFDIDHNHRISSSQFNQIFKVLTKLTGTTFPKASDIDDIFNSIDTDGDMLISFSQFCQLNTIFNSLMQQEHMRLKFKKYLLQ